MTVQDTAHRRAQIGAAETSTIPPAVGPHHGNHAHHRVAHDHHDHTTTTIMIMSIGSRGRRPFE